MMNSQNKKQHDRESMFDYAALKHLLLLLDSDVEKFCSTSNMNIGRWPLEKEDLTSAHVQHRETATGNSQLFWTKAFLQTSTYDEERYRQITSAACERIVQNESSTSKSTSISSRPSSVIAVSLSDVSTIRNDQNINPSSPVRRNSTRQSSRSVPIPASLARFSCYLKSYNTTKQPSKNRKKKVPTKTTMSTIVPRNNNFYRHDRSPAAKKIIKLNQKCRKQQLCRSCDKRVGSNRTPIRCQPCLDVINTNHSHSIDSKSTDQRIGLNKDEKFELEKMIQILIEEFQDRFGDALNISIKQMTRHLLSNLTLFYNHYQQEFEQLARKYRRIFFDRFIQLANKLQQQTALRTKTSSPVQLSKCVVPVRQKNSSKTVTSPSELKSTKTAPPDVLSMSSLSGSLVTDKDLSTPCYSLSLSTTSQDDQKHLSNHHSPSGKTFTIGRIMHPTKSIKQQRTKKSPDSSVHLLDAFRFRDTLRMSEAYFSSPRAKIK